MFTRRYIRIPLIAATMGSVILLGACSSSKTSDTTVAGADTTAAGAAVETTVAGGAVDTTVAGATADTTAAGAATTVAGAAADTTVASASGAAATLTAFGPGCAAVPADGAGSFAGMAKDPAATAASNNPALSTLVAAVTAAGLGDTLNGPGPFTIFAPTNDAFAKIDKDTMAKLLKDPKGDLTKILTFHVIPGKALTAADLLKSGTEATVQGGMVKITGSGQDVTVNGASKVVCGDVKVGNGIVHIIDTVLMPA